MRPRSELPSIGSAPIHTPGCYLYLVALSARLSASSEMLDAMSGTESTFLRTWIAETSCCSCVECAETIVFDVNSAERAYVESNTYRAEAIRFMADRWDTALGR